MFKIVNKQVLAKEVKRVDIHAPTIAVKFQPGQFVSVCPEEGDAKVPLSIVDVDLKKGTIALIFKETGKGTQKLGEMTLKDPIYSVVGPLGMPATIKKKGIVVCVATGIGAAQLLPICRAYQKEGNKVIGIIGAKNKRALMLEAQMRLTCNKLFITTEDGSYERRGLATDTLKELLDKEKVNQVYAIGTVDLLEAVCVATKAKKVKTFVQLNPLMVDCLGVCGSCRVNVNKKMVLACIDGPEFDGHKVDFIDYRIRMNALKGNEEWLNQKSQHNPSKNVSKTLTKFLSGILKN